MEKYAIETTNATNKTPKRESGYPYGSGIKIRHSVQVDYKPDYGETARTSSFVERNEKWLADPVTYRFVGD